MTDEIWERGIVINVALKTFNGGCWVLEVRVAETGGGMEQIGVKTEGCDIGGDDGGVKERGRKEGLLFERTLAREQGNWKSKIKLRRRAKRVVDIQLVQGTGQPIMDRSRGTLRLGDFRKAERLNGAECGQKEDMRSETGTSKIDGLDMYMLKIRVMVECGEDEE
ncbi:hypothetical protein B0H14DRAFT_2560500 [Mycena olivaceomarginata]|nr:hypothetical protein B0H14DRAFT_2560500 [Mycena olivaceomarginata]